MKALETTLARTGALCAAALSIAIPSLPAQRAPETSQVLVANDGQWPKQVGFRTRTADAAAWLVPGCLVLDMCGARSWLTPPADGRPNGASSAILERDVVHMSFEKGHASMPRGVNPLRGVHHFLRGKDSAQWHTDVPTYRSACYDAVWLGIDVVIRPTREGFVAYDFHCAVGADPHAIAMRIDSGGPMTIEEDGTLRIETQLGTLRHTAPIAWQDSPSGEHSAVACRFREVAPNVFGFVVDDHDSSLPLTIDPSLQWSTLQGGVGTDFAQGVARDEASGHVVTAGFTDSPDFPTPGPTPAAGRRDAFVSRFDPSQTGPAQLVWATVIGGDSDDAAFDVAIDPSGLVAITGYTDSVNFPTQDAAQPVFGGGTIDAFATLLSPNGSALIHSTYLGGIEDDWGCGVRLDQSATMTVAGYAQAGFPTTPANAFQPAYRGNGDMFVARINPSGTLIYSTYFGSSGWEGWLWTNWRNFPPNIRTLGLDVDATGCVVLAGMHWPTGSVAFPATTGAYRTAAAGQWDATASILDPSAAPAAQLVWSTLLGDGMADVAMSCAFGPNGNAVIGGYTYSPVFPVTNGAFQTTFVGAPGAPGFNDAFVAWFDRNQSGGAQLRYSTLLAGTQFDSVVGLAVDVRGHATACGWSGSAFPVTSGALVTTFTGAQDGFIARVRPEGRGSLDLTYGTYLPDGVVFDLAPDGVGGTVFAGTTRAASFPTTTGALQSTVALGYAAAAGHLDLLPSWSATACVTRGLGSSPHCGGSILIEVDRLPTGGAPFEILVGNAPATAVGVLILGPPSTGCFPILGANVCMLSTFATVPAFADQQGSFTQRLVWPTTFPLTGNTLGVQTVWINPPTCTQPLSSSATLGL